jgi:hypothetical protein
MRLHSLSVGIAELWKEVAMHHHLSSPGLLPRATARDVAAFPVAGPPGHTGHAHFWERAFSRRRFIRTAAGATALVAGTGLWFPLAAGAEPGGDGQGDDHGRRGPAAPRPIPGTLDVPGLPPLHVDFPWFTPDTPHELSTITDFNGKIAAAEIQGMGTGTDTQNGHETRYFFDADMRIMDGVYVGMDGHTRRGTFGFI